MPCARYSTGWVDVAWSKAAGRCVVPVIRTQGTWGQPSTGSLACGELSMVQQGSHGVHVSSLKRRNADANVLSLPGARSARTFLTSSAERSTSGSCCGPGPPPPPLLPLLPLSAAPCPSPQPFSRSGQRTKERHGCAQQHADHRTALEDAGERTVRHLRDSLPLLYGLYANPCPHGPRRASDPVPPPPPDVLATVYGTGHPGQFHTALATLVVTLTGRKTLAVTSRWAPVEAAPPAWGIVLGPYSCCRRTTCTPPPALPCKTASAPPMFQS